MGGIKVYSTTKHKVGKWIDGKDVYEITLDIPDTQFSKDFAFYWRYNISSLNIDTIVNFSASVVRNNTSLSENSFDFNNASINPGNSYAVYVDATAIQVSAGSNRQNITRVIATIQYTET